MCTCNPAILEKIISIESKLDALCQKLEVHIDFIDERYSYYQGSLDYIKERADAVINSRLLNFFGLGPKPIEDQNE